QSARRPPPPRAGHDSSRRARPPVRGRPSGTTPKPMPTREAPQTRGSRGNLQTRPPGPGPPRLVPGGLEPSAPRPLCQPQPGAHGTRPKKIIFEDELPSRTLLGSKKSVRAVPGGHGPRPHPVPDYELKYPPVSNEKDRSRYAAVFQDQYPEFLELQQEVGSAQAKLQQLEALLNSLPPPRSQQARCHYLKGKLRHLKTQIQKFDDQGDSEGSVYF
ncbi:hypothetical protein DBR06_SOUSAS14010139, partial [Sousa chinensis]